MGNDGTGTGRVNLPARFLDDANFEPDSPEEEKMAAAEMEVRGLLDEARIHIGDAVDALRRASRESRTNDGPYWLHGQLDAYTIPTLEMFADDTRHQPGSIGGLLRELDGEDAR